MSVIEDIRADLLGVLQGVDEEDLGVIHDYGRWSNDRSEFLNLFRADASAPTSRILGWMIEYAGFSSQEIQFGGDKHRVHRFLIHGVLGLEDAKATEKAMVKLAELICDDLDDSAVLSDTGTYHYVSPADMDIFEKRQFGDVFCHYVQIGIELTRFSS